jgi:hypothetical protein
VAAVAFQREVVAGQASGNELFDLVSSHLFTFVNLSSLRTLRQAQDRLQ